MKMSGKNNAGFSLVELMISMTITLILMGIAASVFHHSIGTREQETRRTEAIVAAQTGLNLISCEIANSGYGLTDNGIVTEDSAEQKLHFRANIQNNDAATGTAGEDLTYFFDPASHAVVRYDRFGTPQTSTVIKRASAVSFVYFNYSGFAQPLSVSSVPNSDTARVRITITIRLDPTSGQPDNQEVTYTSDVTLRNSKYVSKNY